MPDRRIVVTRIPPGDVMHRLESVADVWLWEENRAIPRDLLLERCADATGLYCMLSERIDESFLASAPHLTVVSQMAVGVDNIDLDACTARGIPVGHTPDVLTETTADLAFGLLIAGARRFREASDLVRSDAWTQWEPDMLLGHDVHGSTLGIVGLGRIGTAVARRAAGFAMDVVYTQRTRDRRAEQELGCSHLPLDGVLRSADHIVVVCALTPETAGLIDDGAFARMKPSATLINVARGPIVETDALVRALTTGAIAAAALDVTDPEPLRADHPLLQLPNCLVLPHIGSASVTARADMARLAAENLLAAMDGMRMPHCANPAVYGG